jgi:hypothetical protein
MLLRVPAASLNDMAMYAQMAKNAGFKTFAIATKISFDADQAYPKLKFSAIRPLKDDEAQVVLDLRNSPQIDRILQEEISSDEPVTTEAATSFFSEPPVEVAPKVEAPKPFPKVEATKPKVAAPKKAAPPPPVVEQVVEKVIETVQIEDDITFDDDLDAQLDALLPKR